MAGAGEADAGDPQGPQGCVDLTDGGVPLDLTLGITGGATPQVIVYRQGNPCSRTVHIGPVVPPSSQEPNTGQLDVNMHEVNEQIWAQFFSTFGSFKSGSRLLYATSPVGTNGSVGDTNATDNKFSPPSDPGDGTIWIVVHDNRGGATWVTVPVKVL